MGRLFGVASALMLTRIAVTPAQAQQVPFYYPVPPLDSVQVVRGVRFATADTVTLAMDVYRPRRGPAVSPAVIFFSLYWPEDGDRPARENNDQAKNWARILAAKGIVAIIPDLRAEPGTGNASAPARARAGDFEMLLVHLSSHAREYGIEGFRLALFAASGNASPALPLVEDPRQTAIKAAVLYYGGAGSAVRTFRRDIPLFYVRAGLDSPAMNGAIDALAASALSQNAPLTLINFHLGHHAFEAVDDNAATRQIIDQTIEFVRRATAPEYQSLLGP